MFPSAVGGNPIGTYNEGNGLCAKNTVPISHAAIVKVQLSPTMIMSVGVSLIFAPAVTATDTLYPALSTADVSITSPATTLGLPIPSLPLLSW
ncbi:hypothetical protein PC128_g10884 [Phytophthora cactorum]|nr:hypothetical protein PC128_g10884 [Phytophthora cactorum]